MNWRRIAWWGLLLLLASLLTPVIWHGERTPSDSSLEEWADWLLVGAVGLIGIALVLMILEKAGVAASGQRCKICRRKILHGRLYCNDHLKAQVDAAREKYRGQTGLGA